MKATYKFSLSIVGCVFLISCATKPPLPKKAIVDTRVFNNENGSKINILTQNAINGDVIEDTDNNLNVVSKSDNAKTAGLKALQFTAMLLGGGGGSVNGYSKEDLKGVYIASVKNKTMDYLNPELDEILKSINTPVNKKNEITVEPYKFKLIYSDLGSDDYEFRYSTMIITGDFYHICSSSDLVSSDRIKPISAWEENNYELTQVIAKKVIKNCLVNISKGESRVKLTNALLLSTEVIKK